MTDYSLYYWPIPFRGHFARYVLASVGARWDEPGFDAVVAEKNTPVADQPYPFLAPPLLLDHATGQRLSQMPAIIMHLGRTHGLIADHDETLRLVCDASDILLEITRGHGALMWDHADWATFSSERLPLWMQIHERVGRDHGLTPEAGHMLGTDDLTIADLAMAALWHTMIDRLPGMRSLLHQHAPAIEGLVDRIAARPAIAAMLAEWQDHRPLYCGGDIERSLLDMLGSPDPH